MDRQEPGSASMPQGRGMAKAADFVARCAIYLAVVLVPLMYLPWTVNGLEFNKQAVVIVLAVIGTLGWLGRMLVNRRVEWRRSPMHLLIGVYLVIYFLSAWFSESQYASFVGDFGQQNYGVVTLVSFVLLYLVAVNTFRSAREVWKMVLLTLFTGLAILVFAYLQALGLRLFPGQGGRSGAFNLVGTVNALGIYAGFMLALLMGIYLKPEHGKKWRLLRNVLLGLLGVLALLWIAMLSFWVLWMVVVAASVMILAYGMVKTDKVSKVTMLSIPMALVVVGVLFMFLNFPVSLGMPSEVLPSLRASFNISKDALADSPILGSGPGTFLFDYTQFKSASLNETAFWNAHFERSSSGFLTLLATTGILGFASFVVLVGYLAGRFGVSLARGREDWLLRMTVFAGWGALVVGKIFYSTNMTLDFLFWMFTAMLVMLEWRKWKTVEFERSPRAALILSFFFIVAVIFSIAGLYLEGQRYAAEVYYTRAARAQIQNEEDVNQAVNNLSNATRLNGQNDVYYRTLSQALHLKTNLELQKVGAEPTQEQSRNITTLTANAVNTGKRATDISPKNVQNWASLAGLYRDLVGIAEGAREAAMGAYERAIALEPNNPIYHTELGKMRIGFADQLQQSLQRQEEGQNAEVQKRVEELIADAQGNFEKAVELKSDYAPAHYWLAIALQRQGRTEEALSRMEELRQANPNDLGIGLQYAILTYQTGDKEAAIAELERLIELSPDYANARWFLASMYEEAGRLDDAIAQIEAVAASNPDNPNVQARLEALIQKRDNAEAPEEGEEGEEGELPEPIEPRPEGEVIGDQ